MKSLRPYFKSRTELLDTTKELYDAQFTNKPYHLSWRIQAGHVSKYRSDPSFKTTLDPQEIEYFDHIIRAMDKLDTQTASCLKLWRDSINMFNPDCYVFSIGSGSEPAQEIPQFVKNRHDGFTAILNIDPSAGFEDEKSEKYYSSYMRASLNEDTKFMQAFIDCVGELLAERKKVVICDFCDPTHIRAYYALLEKHKAYIDKGLSFFQGYAIHCPVFQIHAGAITSEIATIFTNVIKGFENGRPNPELQNPPPSFTTRFVHVDHISPDTIFKPAAVESLPPNKPSQTSVALFSRPFQPDKQALDEFFENRSSFDVTEDGKSSWEMTNDVLIDKVKAMLPESRRGTVDLFIIKRRDLEELIGTENMTRSGMRDVPGK